MKKFTSFLMIAVCLTVSIAAEAQTTTTQYYSRNTGETIAKLATTTDSTLTLIDSIPLTTNQTGLVEALVIGYAKDTAYSIRGKIAVDFNKRRGTLTLGTTTQVIPIVRDAVLATTGIGGAAFAFISNNGNIYLQVKGKAAYTMRWYSITKLYSQRVK